MSPRGNQASYYSVPPQFITFPPCLDPFLSQSRKSFKRQSLLFYSENQPDRHLGVFIRLERGCLDVTYIEGQVSELPERTKRGSAKVAET